MLVTLFELPSPLLTALSSSPPPNLVSNLAVVEKFVQNSKVLLFVVHTSISCIQCTVKQPVTVVVVAVMVVAVVAVVVVDVRLVVVVADDVVVVVMDVVVVVVVVVEVIVKEVVLEVPVEVVLQDPWVVFIWVVWPATAYFTLVHANVHTLVLVEVLVEVLVAVPFLASSSSTRCSDGITDQSWHHPDLAYRLCAEYVVYVVHALTEMHSSWHCIGDRQ